MTMYTNYLVYYVNKKQDEYGMFDCGLYKVVTIEISDTESRQSRESKAIEKWQEAMDCMHLEVVLENMVYGVPVWSAVDVCDEGQDNSSYYIVVQHLPNKVSQ